MRQAMKVIIDVSKEVEKGRNYLIFPEGTRSKMEIKSVHLKVEVLKLQQRQMPDRSGGTD